MSSSLPVMILLNLSGGTQDACSYFLRDHVFANAQTGNIVLMGCYLISEDLRNSIRYFLPVAFFALGVLMACLIHSRFRHTGKIHWRHLVLTLEIILLFIVGFIPGQLNWLANVLPLPALCRFSPSVLYAAVLMPAPCVSEICEAAWTIFIKLLPRNEKMS